MKKPFILITNDDGIFAPGIKHLWRALVEYADLAIVAPATDQSGVGLGITTRAPLYVTGTAWERDTPAWAVSGTPADCVRMAMGTILKRTPDLIVSGVNRGSNSGRILLYSGTVGGAIEGTLRGIPSVAFSCTEYDHPNYALTEKHIYSVVSYLLTNPLPFGTLLNVNFPLGEIKGFKLARQGRGYYQEDPHLREHPEGYPYYWLSCKWSHAEEEADSDNALLEQGYMTAVPIHASELTDLEHLNKERTSFEALFDPASLLSKGSLEGI